MSNFVTDGTPAIPGPKTDYRPLPADCTADQGIMAADYNPVRTALNDIRTYLTSVQWLAASGEINATTPTTLIGASTGLETITIANGLFCGQRKMLLYWPTAGGGGTPGITGSNINMGRYANDFDFVNFLQPGASAELVWMQAADGAVAGSPPNTATWIVTKFFDGQSFVD